MKKLLIVAMLLSLPAAAEDTRQLARLTPQAASHSADTPHQPSMID